jgi:alkaline phosphatase
MKPSTCSQHKWTGTFLSIVLSLEVLVFGATPVAAAGQLKYDGKAAKYVFLFIGDGMGIPQRTAAENYVKKRLLIDTFPAQGITTTFAADRFITGSAASATALSAGTKTNIGMIGMMPDQKPVKTIAEMARDNGQKVGVISSVSIDHATPAAFYAHVAKRSQYYDIDVALAESGFDFFGGGGIKDPTNKKENAQAFKGDALELIKKAGYRVVDTKKAFMALKPGDGKVLAYNSWLQDGMALPYVMDMGAEDVTLPEYTAKAIEMLENPKGFFLMVEGGKIDWACHANDAAAAIRNTLSFDKAVKQAVDFAKVHADETLIVVTGDHECGGLTLGWAGTKYATDFDILSNQKVSFQKFSDEILKTYKERNAGAAFDTITPLITSHFGLKFAGDSKTDPMVLKEHEIAQLEAAYVQSIASDEEKSMGADSAAYGGYDPLTVALTHMLNNKAGLGWTTFKHTGVPVSTSAFGVGAEIFNGYYDNTEVALKMMAIMGLTPKVHYLSDTGALKVAAN